MKLSLSSLAISADQAAAFAELVGKKAEDKKLALIENAADVYGDDSTDWVDENRAAINDGQAVVFSNNSQKIIG